MSFERRITEIKGELTIVDSIKDNCSRMDRKLILKEQHQCCHGSKIADITQIRNQVKYVVIDLKVIHYMKCVRI